MPGDPSRTLNPRWEYAGLKPGTQALLATLYILVKVSGTIWG